MLNMINIQYYYNYSTEILGYYYRKLKCKTYVFYYEYLHSPPKNNLCLNI